MNKKIVSVFITVMMVVVSLKVNIYSENELDKYPSKTVSGNAQNSVTLSKEARWNGHQNEAIIDLTFKGLEYVKEEVKPTDVVFVVDTSRSMVEAGGVLNPDHTFHLMETRNSGLYIQKTFYAQLDTILSDYVSHSDNLFPDEGKITVPNGIDWKNDTDFKFHIDPQLKIKLPHDLVESMWPNYDNLNNEDIYLVPQIYSAKSDLEFRLDFSNLLNNSDSEVWFAVDFNKEIKIDEKDKNNDFPGESYIRYVPSLIYQKDSKGKRYVEPVERVNWYGEAGKFYNYAWLPLYYSEEDNPDEVQLKDLDGNDAVYDANGVPKSWYKSTKDSNGNRVGEYQRAHLLYDSIEFFVKNLDKRNIGDRFAFASFNTKSNATDISGKPVKSQQVLDYTDSSSDFLRALEDAISHSGEEKYQKDVFNNLITTQGTNYQSGMLASRELMEHDSKKDDETRNKVYIFFSDGQPNYIMDLPFPTGSSSAEIVTVQQAGGMNQADFVHKAFSDNVLNGTFSSYNTFGIGFQENDEKFIKERFTKFINEENIFILDAKNNDNMEQSFENIFKEVYNQSIERTKLVTIEDTIDSRYFKIDKKKLEDPNQTFYPKEYASYTIEKITHGEVEYEKIVFDFKITDLDLLEQKVYIPLLKNEDEKYSGFDGYLPTNYDTESAKGAFSKYIDLNGGHKDVQTNKVWLPSATVKIIKKSSDDQSLLSGAEFKLFYEGGLKQYGTDTYISNDQGEVTIDSLPPGKYVLKESKSPDGYELPSEDSNLDLTLSDGMHKLFVVEILNEKIIIPEPSPQKSNLEISKKVTGQTDKHDASKQFEFKVELGSSESYDYSINGVDQGTVTNGSIIKLKDGDVGVIKDIELGTTFKITEKAEENYTPNFKDGIVSGVIDVTNLIAYENNLSMPITPEPTPQKSNLEISKKVTGQTDKHDASKQFEFKVELGSSASYDYSINGVDQGTVTNGSNIKLKDGDVGVIKDIELGTTFKITEKAEENYTPNFKDGIVSGVIDVTNLIAYENNLSMPITPEPTPQKSNLEISKKVTGQTDKHDASKQFEFKVELGSSESYDYSINGVDQGTVTNGSIIKLKDGDVGVIKDIELGTTFKITEKAEENYTPNYSDGIISGKIESSNIYEYINIFELPAEDNEIPALPIEPEIPESPEVSDKPEKPIGNVEQNKPIIPEIPNNPSEPNDSGTKEVEVENDKDNISNLPGTGVESKQSVYPGLLILGLIVLILGRFRKTRTSR